jgi:hypothetical protein
MSEHALTPHDRPITGEETGPTDTIPQGTVRPNSEGLGTEGPRDWDDVIVHTGEARGLADTAYHSLEPDAPTVGAAIRGHEIDDEGTTLHEIPQTTNAPA